MKYRSTIQLLRKFLSGKASDEEIAKVEKWYKATEEGLADQLPGINAPEETKEKIYQRILSVIEREKKVVPFNKRTSFLITTAAAVAIIVAGLYFLLPVQNATKNSTVSVQPRLKNDIAPPSTNKAMLTLADGTKIDIDSTGNGELAKQVSI